MRKLLNKMILLVLFSSLYVYSIQSQTCNFNVKIEQVLRNEGFHRNLSYHIDFASEDEDESWLYEDCLVGVEQILPAGVYASEDEIQDLGCRGSVQIVFKTQVNIEMPAKNASPIVIHLFSKVGNGKTYMHLPVHARYQQASRGGGTARNEIPQPKLYLSCPNKRLDVCGDSTQAQSQVNSFCHKDLPKEKCDWKQIPAIMVTDTILWDVPVGNTDHYYIVAWGTAVVVVVGSLYLLKNLHKYNIKAERRIRNQYMLQSN